MELILHHSNLVDTRLNVWGLFAVRLLGSQCCTFIALHEKKYLPEFRRQVNLTGPNQENIKENRWFKKNWNISKEEKHYLGCAGVLLISSDLQENNEKKLVLPCWCWCVANASPLCLSVLFSPAGNDLEALHIHLCFCCSNLPPRRAANFGGTLVSAVSNISTSASRRQSGQSGSGWRLQTGRQRYQPLPAHPSCCCPSVADRRRTGSVDSESSATSHHTAWDETSDFTIYQLLLLF